MYVPGTLVLTHIKLPSLHTWDQKSNLHQVSPRAALPYTFERLQEAHVISCFVVPSACSKSNLTLLQALQLPSSSAVSHNPWEDYRLLFWYPAILQGTACWYQRPIVGDTRRQHQSARHAPRGDYCLCQHILHVIVSRTKLPNGCYGLLYCQTISNYTVASGCLASTQQAYVSLLAGVAGVCQHAFSDVQFSSKTVSV